MKFRYIILIVSFFIFQKSVAQGTFTGILKQIEENHKGLKAARLEKEAQHIGAKTGLMPKNPTISYGYFPGSNPVTGTKQLYVLNQELDFPTKYISQFKKANLRQEIIQNEYELKRQKILLEAQMLLIDFVFISKMIGENESRMQNAEKINQLYDKQLEFGNVSILEVNKIKSLLLIISTKNNKARQKLDLIRSDLTSLNGGQELSLATLDYTQTEMKSLDDLKAAYISQHPKLKQMSLNSEMADYNIRISKQGWLPDLLFAYQSELEPGGSYSGFQAGISIPLWNNRKETKSAIAFSVSSESKYLDFEFSLISELESRYKAAQNLKLLLNNFTESISVVSNLDYLDKALDSGEYSIIEYINEMSYSYELVDIYLETQMEYYKLMTKINAVNL